MGSARQGLSRIRYDLRDAHVTSRISGVSVQRRDNEEPIPKFRDEPFL